MSGQIKISWARCVFVAGLGLSIVANIAFRAGAWQEGASEASRRIVSGGKKLSDSTQDAGKQGRGAEGRRGILDTLNHPRCTNCHSFYTGIGARWRSHKKLVQSEFISVGAAFEGFIDARGADFVRGLLKDHPELLKELEEDKALESGKATLAGLVEKQSPKFVNDLIKGSGILRKGMEFKRAELQMPLDKGKCAECHDRTGTAWKAPGIEVNNWIKLGTMERCRKFNQMFKDGKERDDVAEDFLETHLKTDPLVKWAISDGSLPSNRHAGLPKAANASWEKWIDDWLAIEVACPKHGISLRAPSRGSTPSSRRRRGLPE